MTVCRALANLTPQERLILAALAVMLVAGTLTRSWRFAREPVSGESPTVPADFRTPATSPPSAPK